MLMLLTVGSNKVSHGFCNHSLKFTPSIYKRSVVEPMEWGSKWILLIFGTNNSSKDFCSHSLNFSFSIGTYKQIFVKSMKRGEQVDLADF